MVATKYQYLIERRIDRVSSRHRRVVALRGIRRELTIDQHILTVDDISKLYKTDVIFGLSSERARHEYIFGGPNYMLASRARVAPIKPNKYLTGWPAVYLWALFGCAVFASICAHNVEHVHYSSTEIAFFAFGIILLIFILTVIGYTFDVQNLKAMGQFYRMLPYTTTVIRDGVAITIGSEYIVEGDIILLQRGNTVPADIRVIEANSLKVDISFFTGLSTVVDKSANNTNSNPLETENLVFYGSHVVEGTCKGLVFATGTNTFMATIRCATRQQSIKTTPILHELKFFLQYAVGAGMVLTAFLIILLGCLIEHEEFTIMYYLFGALLACVPCSCLVTLSVGVAQTARQMRKSQCLLKQMNIVEACGGISTLCMGKTGILTENDMTVENLYYDAVIYNLLDETYIDLASKAFGFLSRAANLCSSAEFMPSQDHVPVYNRLVKGPEYSEAAILKCMEILGCSAEKDRKTYPKVFELPFNARMNFQLTVHRTANVKELLVVMKGAPEEVIEHCATIYVNDKEEQMSSFQKKRLKSILLELSYTGVEVYAFADLIIQDSPSKHVVFGTEREYPTQGLRFIGLIGTKNPLRPQSKESMELCKEAGIKIVMMTNDYPISAFAIARKIGFIPPHVRSGYEVTLLRNLSLDRASADSRVTVPQCIITGEEMDTLTNEDLSVLLKRYSEFIFARVNSEQKTRIIRQLQDDGEVVGMVGNTIEDYAALQQADIGITMGKSSTDASNDVADIIILDDNFVSVVESISEGRLIYDNLKKSLCYLISSFIPKVAPFILHFAFEFPPIITPLTVVVMIFTSEILPALSYAYEERERDTVNHSRAILSENLISATMVCYCTLVVGFTKLLAALAGYFFIMSEFGFLPWTLYCVGPLWNSDANDVEDTYEQEWSVEERHILEMKGAAAYLLSFNLIQIVYCLSAKTRKTSVFVHGIDNNILNGAVLYIILTSLFVVYCPMLNNYLGLEVIDLYVTEIALPYCFILFFFDEYRKLRLRKRPNGFMSRNVFF